MARPLYRMSPCRLSWLTGIVGMAAAWLAAGCSSTQRQIPCTTAKDCPPGQVCQSGRCTVTQACASDEDCLPELPHCDDLSATCVECLEDNDCATSETCQDNTCQPIPACSIDDDCPPGRICEQGTCMAGCRSSRDCPTGTSCLPEVGPHGTCAQCRDNLDCPEAFLCQDYLCVFHCTADAHCTPDVCDVATGTCVECNLDGDCPERMFCAPDRVCREGCRQDSDCPSGHCLVESHACVDCLTIDDCPLGHLCLQNTCVAGCSSERDCPGSLHCDPNLGEHGTCLECLENSHCQLDQVCYRGSCVFFCTSNVECAPPQPVCDSASGACVECLVKDDCPLGHLCQDQVCVPGCESNRDCPTGQECSGGQCQTVCLPEGEEVCDGRDNDCDGRTDVEDPQLLLDLCELDQGVCRGILHDASLCVGGQWQPCGAAQYGPSFGTEVCDNQDTDCDGLGDNGLQLDCQNQYVCQDGQCVFSGGCTSECAEGGTDCSWLDTTRVRVCTNTDADPCLEWEWQACPPYSWCDPFIFNMCICESEACGDVCCASGQVCHTGQCCSPSCPARTCLADGCGGTCPCELPNDRCVNGVCMCTPTCVGKQCGDDGCQGQCPDTCPSDRHCEENRCICDETECNGVCCLAGQVCNIAGGDCCTPQCSGLECGPDGCGHTCGTCASNERCVDGQCICQPNCIGRECGDDGCGGSCGSCGTGERCQDGICCTMQCFGRACGPDGCGGTCGTCPENQTCYDPTGQCICAFDSCGTSCCAEGEVCDGLSCCAPYCGDGWYVPFHCDDDGCGGLCNCREHYGAGATCGTDLECDCSPPAFTCVSYTYGVQCCLSSQQCSNLFGCY